jgi:pyruvate,water dikinase
VITQQVWGTLLILIVCPILGGLPLSDWLFYLVNKKKLSQIGTGNVSVSAAFYHGGKLSGILAVIAEASKGIIAVLLARFFFAGDPKWELISLLALVIGRYWFSQGAGVTNLVWGIVLHDLRVAILTLIISAIGFTIVRERQAGRMFALFIFGMLLVLLHAGDSGYIISSLFLVGLIWLIYQKIPDDLNLSMQDAHQDSRKLFKFFRADSSLVSLEERLDPQKVGAKAANLSFLKRLGYPVPSGWVLPGGEDLEQIIETFNPSKENLLVVRSSAVGEDSITSSAAGQYLSILNIDNRSKLLAAIIECRESYAQGAAYRQHQGSSLNKDMAIIVQQQITGLCSGVVFSRDPVNPLNPKVVIEALPGQADEVVSGKTIPQRYQVNLSEPISVEHSQDATIGVDLIIQVAKLARELEGLWHGLPQDIEWTYDGEQIWLLQARPITTLAPIWTRKIASEVIPGVIRPLTWSINLPATCGVWGEIFQIVLGKESSRNLDFQQTATLHYQRAYFNATLLGEIFRKMGLPPESLDFLTRGAGFTKPPLISTIKNLPGLLRLLQRELNLEKSWQKDQSLNFQPLLSKLDRLDTYSLDQDEILDLIKEILANLRIATYYSILAPLSLAIRAGIFKVDPSNLDNSQTPEVAALRALSQVEEQEDIACWLSQYGYLSQVATDIAVPRWQEESEKLVALWRSSKSTKQKSSCSSSYSSNHPVQKRLNLKGQVSIVYSKLLAHLRWYFLALEKIYLENKTLEQKGDIFFLEYGEILKIEQGQKFQEIITKRKEQWQANQAISKVPSLVYGKPHPLIFEPLPYNSKHLQGIAASVGEVEGTIRICQTIDEAIAFSSDNILVVPYTDSGWVPLIAQAKGLICEVGGVLSHGAIIAREYGIPAVMDIENVTSLLKNGQKVHLNGYTGRITIVDVQ